MVIPSLSYSKCLTGTLPHQIGNLQKLVVFATERNQIEGSFPLNMFLNMTSLQGIRIWSNKFTGTLSRDVGNLTTVTWFDLSDNQMTGSMI